jgi:CubicO group peptidase (beta-lactamase class C family)
MRIPAFVCLFGFGFTPLATLAAVAHAADAPSVIAPVMQALVDQRIVAGAVTLVVDKDRTLALDAVGCSSLGEKGSGLFSAAEKSPDPFSPTDPFSPMRPDNLFWIASMTKSLTGTALMLLVDEGKVNLNDPVEKYLPEFKGQLVAEGDAPPHPPAHPITVREVMNHTSGLVKASDPVLRNTNTLADRVAKCAATPLIREPGTKYEYNNSGINTGGRIIEVVSGLPYADFMQRRLFDPLGMKDTTFWPNAAQAARLTRTARRGEDKQSLEEIHQDRGLTPAQIEKLNAEAHVPAPILADMGIGQTTIYAHRFAEPAGGLYSTAPDLGAFCQMLLSGGTHRGQRLLSEAAIKTMSAIQTGNVPVNPQEAYGIGWSVKIRGDEGPSIGSYGHRGARRPAMWIDPTSGLAMIVLVERFDMTGDEQKQMYGNFMKAAVAAFGKTAK